ncbi:MAG: PQQ-dependent sugar dehydrogenase [Microscillaceae bacterium]|nr:PQQ-dependent sugar dehydrogenase [Microscillaceae bacterium]
MTKQGFFIWAGLLAAHFFMACKAQEDVFNMTSEGLIQSEQLNFRLDTVATDIAIPWGMAFLPNGDLLCTERSGSLFRIAPNGQKNLITGLPTVKARGQGGLLDVCLHPQFAQNGWIYLSYASDAEPGEAGTGSTTALMRAKLSGNQLSQQEVIFRAQPNYNASHHYGSRIAFDEAGYLYLTVGERGQWHKAQDLDNHAGKTVRLLDNGGIPADNPFVNTPGALPQIFTIGHRNPQGMIRHPETGEIWTHEHGPQGGDEINILAPGRNYGWPVITFGINYDGTIITTDTAKAGMEQPLIYWKPSIAPSGMSFVSHPRYGAWQGDLLVGSLSFTKLVRCEVQNNQVVAQEELLPGLGRVRSIRTSPDGFIYVGVEGPGMIVRLVPTE